MAVIVCGTINSVRSKASIISSKMEKLGYSALNGFLSLFFFLRYYKFFKRSDLLDISRVL